MARTALTIQNIPTVDNNGFNITDATFDTLATGANNGVEFTYDAKDIILLKNTTAGTANYTLVVNAPSNITAVGGTVTSPDVVVAAGKTHLVRPSDVFKQSDAKMYIDCDVAGDVAVLNL